VRQCRDTHPGCHHLDQQQRVIHALHHRVNARRLQEVTPDIQPAALDRIDQQRFSGDILRGNARPGRERVIRGQHQAHFKIKHRRVVQPAARQNV